MKQARIKCPHCGEQITVRQSDGNKDSVSPENRAKIFEAANEMFAAVEAGFRKVFNPALWKK